MAFGTRVNRLGTQGSDIDPTTALQVVISDTDITNGYATVDFEANNQFIISAENAGSLPADFVFKPAGTLPEDKVYQFYFAVGVDGFEIENKLVVNEVMVVGDELNVIPGTTWTYEKRTEYYSSDNSILITPGANKSLDFTVNEPVKKYYVFSLADFNNAAVDILTKGNVASQILVCNNIDFTSTLGQTIGSFYNSTTKKYDYSATLKNTEIIGYGGFYCFQTIFSDKSNVMQLCFYFLNLKHIRIGRISLNADYTNLYTNYFLEVRQGYIIDDCQIQCLNGSASNKFILFTTSTSINHANAILKNTTFHKASNMISGAVNKVKIDFNYNYLTVTFSCGLNINSAYANNNGSIGIDLNGSSNSVFLFYSDGSTFINSDTSSMTIYNKVAKYFNQIFIDGLATDGIPINGLGVNAAGKVVPIPYNTNDKGYFANPTDLRTAYPTGVVGNYAIVGSTDTVWVWDDVLADWKDSVSTGTVISVDGQTGTVILPEATTSTAGKMSASDKTKIDGIEAGAEVNNISDANAATLTNGSNADALHTHSGGGSSISAEYTITGGVGDTVNTAVMGTTQKQLALTEIATSGITMTGNQITIPSTGVYDICAAVSGTFTSAQNAWIGIRTSGGSTLKRVPQRLPGSSTYLGTLDMCIALSLTASDVIQVFVLASGNTTITRDDAADIWNLKIRKVR